LKSVNSPEKNQERLSSPEKTSPPKENLVIKKVRFAAQNSSAMPCKHCNVMVELDL
jgi:hypothetical protein